jgi:hypothetical protein
MKTARTFKDRRLADTAGQHGVPLSRIAQVRILLYQ